MNLRMLVLGLGMLPLQMMGQAQTGGYQHDGYILVGHNNACPAGYHTSSQDEVFTICYPGPIPKPVAPAEGTGYGKRFIKAKPKAAPAKVPPAKQAPAAMPITGHIEQQYAATLDFQYAHSGRIDSLSNEEYARLQKLRQAVAVAEMEIAKAHGVDFGNPGCANTTLFSACDSIYRPGDHYEFRGQFLLINVPPVTK